MIAHEELGVIGKQYGVGLWCQNRPEWQIIDLACVSQALYSVSLYETLGPDTSEYIINHASLTCVATSLNHVPTLLRLASRCPSLKLLVVLDDLIASNDSPGQSKADLLRELGKDAGLKIISLTDLEALGAANPRPYNVPTPSDITAINYTSGTTGPPKGKPVFNDHQPHR